MGKNMLSPRIMLMPMVDRSASPSSNTPVMHAAQTLENHLHRSLAFLASRFDLQATAKQS